VNGHRITHTTTRRLAALRRPAGRVAAPALALLLTFSAAAQPANAATSNAAAKPAATAKAAAAGTTWSQLMRRKLTLGAESARLAALLPGLRATATTSNSDLLVAQQAQTAAATAQATAATADQAAHTRYATARTGAASAKKAVTAALKQRPRKNSRITKAKRTLAAANATVKARAAEAGKTASALKAAQAEYATATSQVTKATTAYQTSAKAITDTQQKITSFPKLDSTLTAQAAAISKQVVTETRASFTTTQTTQVYGVTVNKIVAYPFQRMIDDAAKAGVKLSGGGFRTKQQQIALRTTNGCPDVWTAPSSSCRVPTAIPGRSLHEIGLAIDMTANKKTINDRKSAAFKWLTANAARYGFVNLPSEPWHWSITGN
jgi:D-alanyl-D-alanine carboxypeptidase